MIGALIEGVTQALLPCSWVLLIPAVAIGVTRPKWLERAALLVSVILFAWLAVAGDTVLPAWLSGLLLVAGASIWWSRGSGWISASLIGSGAAAAWEPCVGPRLGVVLNQAQVDPVGAIPGLSAFLFGVIAVGFALGWVIARILSGATAMRFASRFGTAVVGVLGATMVAGVYPAISSLLSSWSYWLWA